MACRTPKTTQDDRALADAADATTAANAANADATTGAGAAEASTAAVFEPRATDADVSIYVQVVESAEEKAQSYAEHKRAMKNKQEQNNEDGDEKQHKKAKSVEKEKTAADEVLCILLSLHVNIPLQITSAGETRALQIACSVHTPLPQC